MTTTDHLSAQPIVIGRIGAPHGLRGWFKVFSYTRPPTNLFHYPQCLLGLQKPHQTPIIWHSHKFDDFRPNGKDFTAHIIGCDNRDLAVHWNHHLIAIPPSDLPPTHLNEFYWSELEGMRVITINGSDLGIVDHLIEVGSHDALVIHGTKIRIIPFRFDPFIKNIDRQTRIITVDWDEDF